eukprot:RCo012346
MNTLDAFDLRDLNYQDFLKRCEDIYELLKSAEDVTQPLNAVNAFLRLVLNGVPPVFDDHGKAFVSSSVPRIVNGLVNRTVPVASFATVSVFFQCIFTLIIRGLQSHAADDELYLALERIFTPSNRLYTGTAGISRITIPGDDNEVRDCKGDKWETAYATYPFCLSGRQNRNTSRLLVRALNTFGHQGGFNECLAWMSSTDHRAPLFVVKRFMKIYKNVVEYLNPKFTTEYFLRVKESFFAYLLAMDDKEAKSERENFQNLVAQAKALLLVTQPREAHELIEALRLRLFLKAFSSSLLELRVWGMTGIWTMLREAQDTEVNSQGWRPSAPRCLSSKAVVRWINENRVIESVFANPHPEVIRLCVPLLVFMAQENYVMGYHLDAIWSSTEGPHEAIQQIVYKEVLMEMVPHMDPSSLNYVYTKLTTIPKNRLDKNTLDFVQQFTVRALRCPQAKVRPKKKKTYGLDVLYETLLEGSGADPATQMAASDMLVTMLRGADCE